MVEGPAPAKNEERTVVDEDRGPTATGGRKRTRSGESRAGRALRYGGDGNILELGSLPRTLCLACGCTLRCQGAVVRTRTHGEHDSAHDGGGVFWGPRDVIHNVSWSVDGGASMPHWTIDAPLRPS